MQNTEIQESVTLFDRNPCILLLFLTIHFINKHILYLCKWNPNQQNWLKIALLLFLSILITLLLVVFLWG